MTITRFSGTNYINRWNLSDNQREQFDKIWDSLGKNRRYMLNNIAIVQTDKDGFGKIDNELRDFAKSIAKKNNLNMKDVYIHHHSCNTTGDDHRGMVLTFADPEFKPDLFKKVYGN